MGLGKHIFVRTVIVPVAACLIGQSACVHQMAAPRRAPKVEDPSSPVITERHSKRVVRLSGVVVRTEADALTGDEVYDAERLFHLAGEADRNGDTAVAKEIYAKLLREFGKSAYADVARFNLGLLCVFGRVNVLLSGPFGVHFHAIAPSETRELVEVDS